MAEAYDPKDVPAEVWLAYERQAKDVMNLWAPNVPALQNAVHAAMIRAWRSGRAVAAEPVAVKPLEWRGSWGTHSADTELGAYEIKPRYDGAADWFAPDQRKHWAPSATEAKAAAQADYEARIRSALALPA